jgi:hypothetical protein
MNMWLAYSADDRGNRTNVVRSWRYIGGIGRNDKGPAGGGAFRTNVSSETQMIPI